MLIKKIFNFLPELDSSKINVAHKKVLDCFLQLEEILPLEYNKYDLVKVITPKGYGVYTLLDNTYYQYCKIKYFLYSKITSKKFSDWLAFKIIEKKKANF